MLDVIPSGDRFTRVLFSVATSLIVAGVVGLWAMSTQVTRVEERVKGLDERIGQWMKSNSERVDYATRQIDEIARQQREGDRRIGVLEGRSRAN